MKSYNTDPHFFQWPAAYVILRMCVGTREFCESGFRHPR